MKLFNDIQIIEHLQMLSTYLKNQAAENRTIMARQTQRSSSGMAEKCTFPVCGYSKIETNNKTMYLYRGTKYTHWSISTFVRERTI